MDTKQNLNPTFSLIKGQLGYLQVYSLFEGRTKPGLRTQNALLFICSLVGERVCYFSGGWPYLLWELKSFDSKISKSSLYSLTLPRGREREINRWILESEGLGIQWFFLWGVWGDFYHSESGRKCIPCKELNLKPAVFRWGLKMLYWKQSALWGVLVWQRACWWCRAVSKLLVPGHCYKSRVWTV